MPFTDEETRALEILATKWTMATFKLSPASYVTVAKEFIANRQADLKTMEAAAKAKK